MSEARVADTKERLRHIEDAITCIETKFDARTQILAVSRSAFPDFPLVGRAARLSLPRGAPDYLTGRDAGSRIP